jgi:hypothetical protein
MKEERAHILEMLQKGKITVDEADLLLDALAETAVSTPHNSMLPIPSVPPIPPISAKLPKTGPKLTAEQILQLNRAGADPEFIRAVRQLHHTSLSGDQIVKMAIEGVDPEFIKAIGQLENLSLTGEQIMKMGIEGVDAEFIKKMKNTDFLKELDGDAFVKMAIEGIDDELLLETIQLL